MSENKSHKQDTKMYYYIIFGTSKLKKIILLEENIMLPKIFQTYFIALINTVYDFLI